MSLSKHEFTNAGRSMLGRAQNGETLIITQLVVGSGVAGSPPDLWPLTVLLTHELDVPISSKRDYGNGVLLVEGNFRSDAAPHAFNLCEVGVMAHIGSEADRLYSVANVFTDPPVHIDPAAPVITAFKIKCIIDRIPSDSVVVQIGPTEAITGENIGADTVGPGFYKESVGNIQRFKRAHAGAGMSIIEDESGDFITFATKQLTYDVDLYVPMSYPAPPPGALLFPTIQAAHDYLLQFRIPADKTATIHIAAGTFNVTAPINFNHPDSPQIHVLGQPRVDKALGGVQFVSTTTKRLLISDTTGLVFNQLGWVALTAPAWCGGCKITSPTPHPNDVQVTIEKPPSGTSIGDYILAAAAGGRYSHLPTVVSSVEPPSLFHPIFNFQYGIGSIENICATGSWAGFSFNTGGGIVKNCMAYNCTRGINIGTGGVGLMGEVVFTKCAWGMVGAGTIAGFEQRNPLEAFAAYVNACDSGIAASNAGFGIGALNTSMTSTVVYLVRNRIAASGGNYIGGALIYVLNDVGLKATSLGVVHVGSIQNIPGSGATANGTDLLAEQMSLINYGRAGGPMPATVNPHADLPGDASNDYNNQNSWIHITP